MKSNKEIIQEIIETARKIERTQIRKDIYITTNRWHRKKRKRKRTKYFGF